MARQNQIGRHQTSIYTDQEFTRVVYHSTPVVSFNDNSIVLNTGGYKTYTTKVRMNQTSNQFALGFYVYQKEFKWFVDFMGQTIEMKEDILTLNRRGEYQEKPEGLKHFLD